jgi:hypothetical protein
MMHRFDSSLSSMSSIAYDIDISLVINFFVFLTPLLGMFYTSLRTKKLRFLIATVEMMDW